MEAFSKGNEAFVAESYEDAVELYTRAISEDDGKDDFYVNRSHAYIKLEKYQDALTDADAALKLNSINSKAYLRKGIALFHLEDYAAAKSILEEGQKLDESDKQWSVWLRKCEAEIDLAKNKEKGEASVNLGVSEVSIKKDTRKEPAPLQESQKPGPVPMPTGPKTRYDWYQTETQVIITVMLKNTKKEDVKLITEEQSMSLTVKLPTGSDYVLDLDLAHPIVPDQTLTKVVSSKIEIKLKKREGFRWSKLEGDPVAEEAQVKQFNPSGGPDAAANKYPTSAHYTRDWDKLVSDIKKEEKDEKLEGDAALNQLFQQIYADGSDEVKKAMNKSFAESGGTVLSTNWNEVGTKQVECKPPDGMEYKKYNQ